MFPKSYHNKLDSSTFYNCIVVHSIIDARKVLKIYIFEDFEKFKL